MVKINSATVYPELPLEFTLDGTEEFRKGTLKLDNLEEVKPFDDYSKVDITINGIDYKFILESDLPNRVSKNKTTHQITLLEQVVNLNDVMIPDRAFSTAQGVQTTWKYQLETIIETSNIGYSVAEDTLELLNVTANNQQYSGSFLNFLVIAFRAVDAVPSLDDTEIGHNLLNAKNNNITTEVQAILDNDNMESRRYEANINDYASSVYSKVKNGSYEESEEIGATWFPSKTGYTTVRSGNNKYNSDDAEIQFNGGQRRIAQAFINLAVVQGDQTYQGLFGSTSGDVPSVGGYGDRYQCEEDGFTSANAGLTFDTGDTAVYIYNKWYKNALTTDTIYIDADISDYCLSKEEWDKKEIETTEATLYAGVYANNSFYLNEGGDTLENIGVQYNTGLFTNPTAYKIMRVSFAEVYNLDIGDIDYNKILNVKWRFKLIPARDYDTDIERHTSARVKYKSVKTNQQQESRVEIGKYGKANYQFVNRMGNERFEITIRYFESDPYSLGLKTYDDIFELFDYYKGYKIVKIKFMIYSNMIDCTYLFVANQSNLNPNSAFTNPVSPYTIQDKIEAKTCYVRKHYLVFGDSYTEDTLNATTKLILWNRFDYSPSYDTPIYTAVYSSLDSSDDIALDVQRAIEGRGFTFNTQFNSKTIAGSKIEAVGLGDITHKLTPINYTNDYGEVDECVIEYCNDVTINPIDYPVASGYTSLFGNYTRSVKLQPNEILGETQRIECITDRENLFIYKNFLLNNSILREIEEDITLQVYYYDNPIFTTDTKAIVDGFVANDYPTVTLGKITLSGNNLGYSYAIVDSFTKELYFAYNYYGDDLLEINMSMSSYNVSLVGKGLTFYELRVTAEDIVDLSGSVSIAITKENKFITVDVIDIASIDADATIVITKENKDISAQATDIADISANVSIDITKYIYNLSADAQDISSITASVELNQTNYIYNIGATATDIANVTAEVDIAITSTNNNISAQASDMADIDASVNITMPFRLTITATNLASVTGSVEYTYSDPLVEWVEVTTGTVTGGNCYVSSDIGNIKEEIGSCQYVTSGSAYFSGTDESTSQPICEEDATYTLCIYNSGFGYYVCRDYVGTIPTIKYECQLK